MEVVERRIVLVSGAVVALAMAVHYYRSISHECYTVVAGIITATVTHWQLCSTGCPPRESRHSRFQSKAKTKSGRAREGFG